ncbi:uncharacterized protein BDR25DRAFT_316391 [Lindgomyces ingoldianus]|uniref:Uncharacterized protein n=1 Tax=Lindgomyces ingoldianus TaxID=673940 RepID=A0ACB6QMS0_9PLEO|nr:uncharacterized protein BDR25DRAFT_316391 [Lindgomyces ingoldianus]KAF2468279.1 hypothetical protein BDR25DRAFT_316391 [Lindgomyces ingoldianus]
MAYTRSSATRPMDSLTKSPTPAPEKRNIVGLPKQESGLLDLQAATGEQLKVARRNQQSLLVRLPAELRNKIYGYATGGNILTIDHARSTSFVPQIFTAYSSADEVRLGVDFGWRGGKRTVTRTPFHLLTGRKVIRDKGMIARVKGTIPKQTTLAEKVKIEGAEEDVRATTAKICLGGGVY